MHFKFYIIDFLRQKFKALLLQGPQRKLQLGLSKSLCKAKPLQGPGTNFQKNLLPIERCKQDICASSFLQLAEKPTKLKKNQQGVTMHLQVEYGARYPGGISFLNTSTHRISPQCFTVLNQQCCATLTHSFCCTDFI